MAKYAAGVSKASGAAAAWLLQLRTPSTVDARVWEVHCFAETAVAGTVALIRSASVGATFTSTIPQAEDAKSGAALVTVDTAATTAPTVSGTPVHLRRTALAATIGSGIIWTFPEGLVVPVSSGLLVWQLSAAAVTYGVTFVYDE